MLFNFLRVLVLLISVCLSLAMIVYSLLKGKKNKVLGSYVWTQLLVFIWLTAQLLRLAADRRPIEYLFINYEYLGICFIGVSWLFFCLRYTGQKIMEHRIFKLLILIPPIVSYLAVLTNPYHHLFFPAQDFAVTKGILFYVHAVFVYLYCFYGTLSLFKHSAKQLGYRKMQSLLLTIAVILPFIANYALISGFFDPGFDTTPITFVLSMFFFALAVFKYKLLNIMPIAHRKIVENMTEAIIIADLSGEIIEFNQSFAGLFPRIVGQTHIDQFFDQIPINPEKSVNLNNITDVIKKNEPFNVSGELHLDEPVAKSLIIHIQPLFSGKEIVGKFISLNDITEIRQLLDALHEKNQELLAKNQQLMEYSAQIEELAVTKERNRFARDVHDTLGQTMTVLVALLEVSKINCRQNPDMVEAKLTEAIRIAGEGLKEVRRSVTGLSPEKVIAASFRHALESLIDDYRSSGIEIELTMDGFETFHQLNTCNSIYRICQEALTNSLRHGHATRISIILRFTGNVIQLYIFDNGSGCSDIKKGYGLNGMEQRVVDLGGRLVYGSDGESGFNIRVEIPTGDDEIKW